MVTATIDPRLDVAAAIAQIATLPAAIAEESINEFYAGREHRRVCRERRGRSGPQPRCSACCRFKSNTRAQCRSCGYAPGQGYTP